MPLRTRLRPLETVGRDRRAGTHRPTHATCQTSVRADDHGSVTLGVAVCARYAAAMSVVPSEEMESATLNKVRPLAVCTR